MHDSADRLYQAAKLLRQVVGQSNLARLLNESPQTVKNWETRGVSDAGAIKAEGVIGCSAYWLSTGKGDMQATGSAPTRRSEPTHDMAAALAQIAAAVQRVPLDHRQTLAQQLAALAVAPDSAQLHAVLLGWLQAPALTAAPQPARPLLQIAHADPPIDDSPVSGRSNDAEVTASSHKKKDAKRERDEH